VRSKEVFRSNGVVIRHGINDFDVELENEVVVRSGLSGKLKRQGARILTGDNVIVSFDAISPLETCMIEERRG